MGNSLHRGEKAKLHLKEHLLSLSVVLMQLPAFHFAEPASFVELSANAKELLLPFCVYYILSVKRGIFLLDFAVRIAERKGIEPVPVHWLGQWI